MAISFDIESDVLDEFIDINGLNKDDKNAILKACLKFKPFVEDNYNHIENLSDVEIGQYIKITYVPDSQRYIEHYESLDISGYLIYKNKSMTDALILHIDSGGNYILQSYIRYGCSYFGTSLGYSIFITGKNNL